MSEEIYEYAEKILVKLRDEAKEQTKIVGEIIGENPRHGIQGTSCGFCGIPGPAKVTLNDSVWIGVNCCRTKSPNQLKHTGGVRCAKCQQQNQQGKRQHKNQNHWGICDTCISEGSGSGEHLIENFVVKELKKVRSAKSKLKKAKTTAAEKAKPYINAGLAESFALAIARGTDDGEILDLWESKWWKQYEDDDMLIVAVLEGRLTEDQGKYLNSIRSDHERLALTCVEDPEMIEWSEAILNSGFDKVPEAVNDALDGGQPHIIARIRKMQVTAELLPPALEQPVLLKNPPPHMQEKPEEKEQT